MEMVVDLVVPDPRLALETFLGGMEIRKGRSACGASTTLETFLGGMEITRGRENPPFCFIP